MDYDEDVIYIAFPVVVRSLMDRANAFCSTTKNRQEEIKHVKDTLIELVFEHDPHQETFKQFRTTIQRLCHYLCHCHQLCHQSTEKQPTATDI